MSSLCAMRRPIRGHESGEIQDHFNGLPVLILEWSMGTEMISPGWGRPIWPGLLLECS